MQMRIFHNRFSKIIGSHTRTLFPARAIPSRAHPKLYFLVLFEGHFSLHRLAAHPPPPSLGGIDDSEMTTNSIEFPLRYSNCLPAAFSILHFYFYCCIIDVGQYFITFVNVPVRWKYLAQTFHSFTSIIVMSLWYELYFAKRCFDLVFV